MESAPVKKLFERLGALALAVLAPILLLDWFYVHTEHFRRENGVLAFKDVPARLDLVNTGTSHGKYGFRYEELRDVKGFNLAMEGQPFLYDLAMLREFADHLRPGAVVLFPVSGSSFHRHPGTMPQIRPRYYRILSRRNNPEFHWGEAMRHSLLPVLGAGRNITAIWHDAPEGENPFLHASLGTCTADELVQLARSRHKDGQVVVINQANEQILEENEKLLETMICTCRESGWVPVLVVMPFVRALVEQDSDAFRREFDQRLAKVRTDSGNPILLDYAHDPRFLDSPELFADVDHMNAKGAVLFTAQVVADLRKRGLLTPSP